MAERGRLARFSAMRSHATISDVKHLGEGRQLQGVMATTRQNQEAPSQRKVEGVRPARTGTDERLRGEVQQQIFRSKLLMLRARELLDALLALARGRHN